MKELVSIVILGTMSGLIGTGLGGLLLALGGRPSPVELSFLLSLAGGVMLAVTFQDLIPQAVQLGGLGTALLGLTLGAAALAILRRYLPEGRSGLARTGLLIGAGIALHNLPEGLAVGAGSLASPQLGFNLALALCFHDIPEGMAMAAPLLAAGLARVKVVFWTILAGLPMGAGALVGALLGTLSPVTLAASLGFAAGAMLYLVFQELLPQADALRYPSAATLGSLVGVVLGLILLTG